MWLHTSAINNKQCHQVKWTCIVGRYILSKVCRKKISKSTQMFKLREETKTNEGSEGEISLTCVWQRKPYNILTVKITMVRTLEGNVWNSNLSVFRYSITKQLSTAMLAALWAPKWNDVGHSVTSFAGKPKYCTNWNFGLMMALDYISSWVERLKLKNQKSQPDGGVRGKSQTGRSGPITLRLTNFNFD